MRTLLLLILTGLIITCSTNRCAKEDLGTLTVANICKNSGTCEGEEFTLRGEFLGWSGSDCVFPDNASAGITRSDWIFRDGTGCIYVSGGKIAQLDPFEKNNVGTQISIRVIPRLGPDQKMYLEFISGTIVKTR